MSFIKQDLFIN